MPRKPDEVHKFQRMRYYARRAEAIEKLGGKCAWCGSKRKLTFTRKGEGVSQMRQRWAGKYERFLKEVDLTMLLCQSCHAKKIRKTRPGFRHGTYYAIKVVKCNCDLCAAKREEVNANRRKPRTTQNV